MINSIFGVDCTAELFPAKKTLTARMPRSRRTIHARVIVEIDRRPCAGVKETGQMEISTERKGDVLVAGAQDRIDGANAREFQEALQAVIDDSDRAVVLDLEQLTYISSAGLRVILLMGRMLQRQNGKFRCLLTLGTGPRGLQHQWLRQDHPDPRLSGRGRRCAEGMMGSPARGSRHWRPLDRGVWRSSTTA